MRFKKLIAMWKTRHISEPHITKIMETFGSLGFDAMLVAFHPEFEEAAVMMIVGGEDKNTYLTLRSLCKLLKKQLDENGLEFDYTIKQKAAEK